MELYRAYYITISNLRSLASDAYSDFLSIYTHLLDMYYYIH